MGNKMGKIYLVGAGPGDVGLLTIKGMEKLRECDAVVYDRLGTEGLLDYVGADCERIYVGKQAGKHYRKQDEINKILVDCARRHKCVVRLKGGDSFVFGRGGEEIEALNTADIPYEVIPGITSAVAVPECAGIPVTHRGVSRSFHVITGHTKNSTGSPDYDYEVLAKLEGTLVFLMGLSNLDEIAQKLLQAGMAEDTPAAVIADGTTARQQTVRGCLADIAAKAESSGVFSPAVIVIGKTAEYHFKYIEKPYKRVGITATKALQQKMVKGFDSMGMEAVSVCDMQLVRTEQIERLRQEMEQLEEYQWIIFTSQNAVTIFFEELRHSGVDIRSLGKTRFAVLGSGTADKLREYGIMADFIPSRYTVSVLAREFAQVVKSGEKVLIPRAVQGSPVLTEVLKEHGIVFQNLAVYDVKGCLTENIQMLDRLDYLVFVSASGVQAFFQMLQERKVSLPDSIQIACIGDITGRKLEECYGQADVVANANDVEGLFDAIRRYEKQKR